MIHFHHDHLSSLALIPAYATGQNLLNLSLKFQIQKCESYIRETKDFIINLSSITSTPENSFLVTFDVSALYINIDHEEGAGVCFRKLQGKKSILSTFIENLILMNLKSSAFQFGME